MLKLIIVDDEELEREGLRRNIAWNELGIELIGVYASGKQALEAIMDNPPDIVLTDIMMPDLNGIQFSKQIREEFPQVKIVIISGYDNFHFAKSAIDVEAYRYILKPYNVGELLVVIKDLVVLCEMEHKAAIEQDMLRQKIMESMPLLLNKFYLDLLYGLYNDEQQLAKRIDFLDIKLRLDALYIVYVFELDDCNAINKDQKGEFDQVMPLLISERIRSQNQRFNIICVGINETRLAVLLLLGEDGIKEVSDDWADMLHRDLHRYFNRNISIGISRPFNRLVNSGQAYRQALDALAHKFIIGHNQLIHYDDVVERESLELDLIIGNAKNELLYHTKLGNADEVTKQHEYIVNKLVECKADKIYIRNLYIDIVNSLFKMLWELNVKEGDLPFNEVELIAKVFQLETLMEMREWMDSVFRSFLELIHQKSYSKIHKIIEEIKNVVYENFRENLTVPDIALKVYLSAGYATTLFKKETGKTIMDFIIETRIEYAKKRLADPHSKIYEVSQEAGYSNVTHFSSIFKNIVGISPKEYRNRNTT